MSSSSESSTVLYKILTDEEHSALFSPPPAKGAPKWFGSPLDLGDGFIHTSSSKQVSPTFSLASPSSVYARCQGEEGEPNLLILNID